MVDIGSDSGIPAVNFDFSSVRLEKIHNPRFNYSLFARIISIHSDPICLFSFLDLANVNILLSSCSTWHDRLELQIYAQ